MQSRKNIPRGLRNNNPLNIRIGNNWLGERKNQDDDPFEQFISMKYGIRAAFVVLRRYIRIYHRDTIRKIIESWAPRCENDTQSYIDTVCRIMAKGSEDTIRYEDEKTMVALLQAMARVECGELLDLNLIRDAYKMA